MSGRLFLLWARTSTVIVALFTAFQIATGAAWWLVVWNLANTAAFAALTWKIEHDERSEASGER